jgi:hypothetical protein
MWGSRTHTAANRLHAGSRSCWSPGVSTAGCIFGNIIRAARAHRRLAITQLPSRWSPHTSSSTRRFQEP